MSGRSSDNLPPRAEVEAFAQTMAHNACLDIPLPPHTDFSAEEVEKIQSQVRI